MVLPHNAQCPSVRGMRSLTTTNLVRCRNPLLAKVRFGFISSSRLWSKISCPARNAESSPAHAPYFSRWTISNTNSKKHMIALRCLLDVSDQFLGRALSTLETSALRSDIIEIAALSDLFLAGVRPPSQICALCPIKPLGHMTISRLGIIPGGGSMLRHSSKNSLTWVCKMTRNEMTD